MKILLTGGTGFLGKTILNMLKRGELGDTQWTMLSRSAEHFLLDYPSFGSLSQVEFCSGDVRDVSLKGRHYDLLIHAATSAHALPPGEARSVILDGTRNILQQAGLSRVSKFIYISSGAVYGNLPENAQCFSENFACSPITEYGQAKYEAEKLCLKASFPVYIARCFAFGGLFLDQNIHFAMGNFIRDAMAGMPIRIQGDGTAVRTYLDAEDWVRWLFLLVKKGESFTPYNIGGIESVSILKLAQTVKEALNSSSEIRICNQLSNPGGVKFYVPNVSRMLNLGAVCHYTLHQIIQRTAGVSIES